MFANVRLRGLNKRASDALTTFNLLMLTAAESSLAVLMKSCRSRAKLGKCLKGKYNIIQNSTNRQQLAIKLCEIILYLSVIVYLSSVLARI